MSYEIPGYDGWKLSTPWDDEVAMTVSFECDECQEWNESVDAVGSKGSYEVHVECENCYHMNCVDVEPDWD